MLNDGYKKKHFFVCFLRFHNNTQIFHGHVTHRMSTVTCRLPFLFWTPERQQSYRDPFSPLSNNKVI